MKFLEFTCLGYLFACVACTSPVKEKRHHVLVSSAEDLHKALQNATAGDMIILMDGTYVGPFVASVNGEATKPIFVVARKLETRNLTIAGTGTEAAFKITGNHWRMIHLNFDGFVGLHVTGDDFWGNDLVVRNSETGIMLEGKQNIVMRSYVADAKNVGILVKGDKSILARNTVVCTKESIKVDKIACCGYLKDNLCEGNVVINGTKITEKNTVML